jgi:excisionase family DNA binding protein
MKDLLTVSEVAMELELSPRRIHDFIKDGRLPAEKFGSYYLIKRADLDLVKDRSTGRPPKVKDKG